MRFALATVGTRGDVQPLLAVAVELRRRGHQALIGAPAKFEQWVREHDVEFASVGVDPEELLAAEKSPGRMRALMKADAKRQFETLAEVARGSDLIVGAGVVLAASSVAELMRVPFVGAVFSPQTLPSAEHPFPPLSARRPPRWVNRLSWWLGSAVYGWLTLPLLNEHRKAVGLSPHTSAEQHMFGDDVLLASEPLFGYAPGRARIGRGAVLHRLRGLQAPVSSLRTGRPSRRRGHHRHRGELRCAAVDCGASRRSVRLGAPGRRVAAGSSVHRPQAVPCEATGSGDPRSVERSSACGALSRFRCPDDGRRYPAGRGCAGAAGTKDAPVRRSRSDRCALTSSRCSRLRRERRERATPSDPLPGTSRRTPAGARAGTGSRAASDRDR